MISDINPAVLLKRISDLEQECGRLEGMCETLQFRLETDQETTDVICEFVSRSRAFRDTLIRCYSVGWPVDVQQAFYRWQRLLDGLIVFPPTGEMDDP